MKKTLSTLASAALFASTLAGASHAASMEEMMAGMQNKMACSAACNSDYGQCVANNSDYSASTEMLMERTKMNMMAPVECAKANMQCNAAC